MSSKYYLKNKEEILKRSKAWSLNNKEKRKIIRDKWRSKNKEHTNFLTRRYIYRRKHAIGKINFKEEQEIYQKMPLCPYCNKNKTDTIDHVVPLSKGGTNNKDNLIAVCRSCNSKKGAKSLLQFNPILYMMWSKLRT